MLKINKLQNKMDNLINYLHRIIFNSEAGEHTFTFIKNISFSFFWGLLAFVILFGVNIVAARLLGPSEYGKYALVFSVAQMLALLYVLELDVSVLYFLTDHLEKKRDVISSIIFMFFTNTIVFTFFVVSIYKVANISAISAISQIALLSAILMALSFAFKRMIDAFLRTKRFFKKQAIFKTVEATIVAGALIIFFFWLGQRNYFLYVWAIVLGGLMFTVLGIIKIGYLFTIRNLNVKCINKVFKYSMFGLIGAVINGVVKNVDKLIVVVLLGVSANGLYMAYFTASVIIGARLTQLFINVFFPTVRSKNINTKNVFTKINKLYIKMGIPMIIMASGGVALIMVLYGSKYKFVWPWVVLGGIYITINFFTSLYGWLLSSISRKGYKIYNISFVYGIVMYSGFLWIMFKNNLFSITILLLGLIIYRIVGGIISYFTLKRMMC